MRTRQKLNKKDIVYNKRLQLFGIIINFLYYRMNVYEHIQGYPGKRGQIFVTHRRGRTGEKSLRFFTGVAR